MKSCPHTVQVYDIMSHPARGAWIEMVRPVSVQVAGTGRTPQGVRGLKYLWPAQTHRCPRSHPARGAWIEMSQIVQVRVRSPVAPRKGCGG